MSENCTHDCSTCGESCAEREPESLLKPLRAGSRVDKVIAVVSGKGGVGKSLVTSLLACEMQRRGHQAAVLDADITGPSIPQAFGIHSGAIGGEDFIYANRSKTGIELMSINLLLPNETDPVVWRGPVIAGAVTQFWTDVLWEDVEYMFVDMPPGTGDVPLTVFQSLPVDGILIVTSPQLDLDEYIARSMAQGLSEQAVIDVIVGDFQRMEVYAQRGYQIPQAIPDELRRCFDELVAAGCTGELVT